MQLWECNAFFYSLKGRKILNFTQLIPKVVELIVEKYQKTDDILALCESLGLWKDMEKFMNITAVVYGKA